MSEDISFHILIFFLHAQLVIENSEFKLHTFPDGTMYQKLKIKHQDGFLEGLGTQVHHADVDLLDNKM